MSHDYEQQVRLLLRVLPLLSVANFFALKGGTAINFFVRDYPRLSVDIDLTYLPIKNRVESLKEITSGVQRIGEEIEKRIHGVRLSTQKSGGTISKLIIRNDDAQIKLEVNTVLRGAIYSAVEMELSQTIQEKFELFAAVKSLSFEELYGGKICAALDRQHPRDLFDVRLLLQNEGITENVRKAFIGYLISHSRPINELLNPNIQSIEEVYKKEFSGMINNEESLLEELMGVQKSLPKMIIDKLTEDEKKFLISFKKGNPDWKLMGLPILKDLPGVKWKRENLLRMDKQKHRDFTNRLEKVLYNG